MANLDWSGLKNLGPAILQVMEFRQRQNQMNQIMGMKEREYSLEEKRMTNEELKLKRGEDKEKFDMIKNLMDIYDKTGNTELADLAHQATKSLLGGKGLIKEETKQVDGSPEQFVMGQKIGEAIPPISYTEKTYPPTESERKVKEAVAIKRGEAGIPPATIQPGYGVKNAIGGYDVPIPETEKDIPDITKFEKLHPEWTGKIGTPEYYKAYTKYQLEVPANKAIIIENAKMDLQRGMISDATKESAYQYLKTAGEFPPELSRIFRLPGAQVEMINYATKRQEEEGITGIDRAVMKASYEAGKISIKNQEKIRGMMGGFTRNIDKQVSRVEEIGKDLVSRIGIRALDLPRRELLVRYKGSGNERILESYLMEISREIGKLTTGSSASIAELSVEAQKKWDKIHDPNLSLRELQKILNETRQMAKMRMESAVEEIEYSKGRLIPEIEEKTAPISFKYLVNGKNYSIPKERVAEFLKDNPNAKVVK